MVVTLMFGFDILYLKAEISEKFVDDKADKVPLSLEANQAKL